MFKKLVLGTSYLRINNKIGLWVGSAALAHIQTQVKMRGSSSRPNPSHPTNPILRVFKAIERGGSRDGRAASAYLEKADCQQLRSDTCPAPPLVSRPAAGTSLAESPIS